MRRVFALLGLVVVGGLGAAAAAWAVTAAPGPTALPTVSVSVSVPTILPTTSVRLPTTVSVPTTVPTTVPTIPRPPTTAPTTVPTIPRPPTTLSTPTLPRTPTVTQPSGSGSTTGSATGSVTGAVTGAVSGVSGGGRSSGGGTASGTAAGGTGSGSGGSGSTASGSGSTASGPAGSAAAGAATSQQGPRVVRLGVSRSWIRSTGRKSRATTLTFVLWKAHRVVFTITQVSPACVGIGHFTVKGHRGVNRIRFRGRVHGRPLHPGTYRISVRTADGTAVRQIVLVVVGNSTPSDAELRALRAANTCPEEKIATGSSADNGNDGTGAAAGPTQTPTAASSGGSSDEGSEGFSLARGRSDDSGILGSTVQKTARTLQPILLALLALSILLLGLASLPRIAAEPRLNYLLAQHRAEIAALGAAALVAVALAFVVS